MFEEQLRGEQESDQLKNTEEGDVFQIEEIEATFTQCAMTMRC
jgi:hypothetical protein